MQVHTHLDVGTEVGDDLADDPLDLVRQRATVGVAQHEGRGAALEAASRTQAELGVALVAVEEVLGVEQHLEPGAAQVLDRVGHHGDALFERGLQRLGHVVVPALADDAHRPGARFDEVAERVVGVDLAELAPGRAEGHQPAGVEVELGGGAPEELVVLGVGARPTTFDVVHAQPIELLGDAELVVDGERDALELAAVAQRRVEDLD